VGGYNLNLTQITQITQIKKENRYGMNRILEILGIKRRERRFIREKSSHRKKQVEHKIYIDR